MLNRSHLSRGLSTVRQCFGGLIFLLSVVTYAKEDGDHGKTVGAGSARRFGDVSTSHLNRADQESAEWMALGPDASGSSSSPLDEIDPQSAWHAALQRRAVALRRRQLHSYLIDQSWEAYSAQEAAKAGKPH